MNVKCLDTTPSSHYIAEGLSQGGIRLRRRYRNETIGDFDLCEQYDEDAYRGCRASQRPGLVHRQRQDHEGRTEAPIGRDEITSS